MVHECPYLLVLAALLSVPPLNINYVCLSGLEIGLTVVLGQPNLFHQFLQMVPQDLDVVVALLSLIHPVRLNMLMTWIEYWCDRGRTLLYPNPYQY